MPNYQGSADVTVNAVDQTNWSLRRFGPFGGERSPAIGTWPAVMDKGFVGGTKDTSTGLTHLGAREYDPSIGRFISVDPIFAGGDPVTWNGFAYAANNPITNSDADGRMCSAGSFPVPCGPPSKPDCGSYGGGYGCFSSGRTPNMYRNRDHRTRITYTPAPPAPPPCTSWTCKFKKAGQAAGNFVSKHRATIASVAVGVGCGVAIGWTGAGGVACAAAAGAVYGVVSHAQNTPRDQWSATGFLLAGAKGAAIGVATHGAFGLVGRIAAPIVRAVAPRVASKIKFGGGKGGSAGKGNPTAKAKPVPPAKPSTPSKPSGRPAPNPACSFVPGTAVLMADGTHKPIDELQVGDEVLATDPDTGKTAPQTVLTTYNNAGTKQLVTITVDTDGKHGTKTGTLTATDNHPFWLPAMKQWKNAGDLNPGMWLRTSDGTHVQVTAVKTRTAYQRVHNLTVDTDHTYYVLAGSTPVLVHNCGPTDADVDPNIVYRALAKGEDPALGLTARDPSAVGVEPLSHVAGKKASPWISTSKLPSVAFDKYNGGHGVVAIDLSKVTSRIEDISGGFPGKGRFDRWARKDQEVLIFGEIHPDAIIGFWS